MYLIFDTETTGLPKDANIPSMKLEEWPRLVQLAWQLHGEKGNLLSSKNYIVKPDGFNIPFNAEKVHGISTEKALKDGRALKEVLEEFAKDLQHTSLLVGHNIVFDLKIMEAEFFRTQIGNDLLKKEWLCTKESTAEYCQIPGGKGGKFKWPTLGELYKKLFDKDIEDAHNAAFDVEATARCFFQLLVLRVLQPSPLSAFNVDEIEYERPDLDSEKSFVYRVKKDKATETAASPAGPLLPFSHLHVHSQYSVLQSTGNIDSYARKAKEDNMPALALTDLGNMFGAFSFVRAAKKAGIKPIIGCELNVTEDHTNKNIKDNGYQQVFLAKNLTGYKNLIKLSSIAFLDGYYYVPRISRELVKQYSEGLIATTGYFLSEIPDLILNVGDQQAENAFKWWLDIFGEDFYVELNRHGLEEDHRVNEVLLRLADKYNVKVFAANNCFYADKDDAAAHDILLCVRNGEYQSTPVGKGRGFRFGFPNEEFYFKTTEEMNRLFEDIPEAIENINEIINKVESYDLEHEPIMPDFPLPDGFSDPNEYLRHLTYEGATKRYKEITPAVRERIDFELDTIQKMGYPGYFLIVQDFLHQARKMGVSVGPGRGSAAGSVVSYCTHITDVDPMAYGLLFERFLNPDRISLPDIDIDFDEDGRERIMNWVVNKYGKEKVAQIITFGKMAPKMAIRDVARVLQLPLNEADRLAKLVPETPGMSFEKAYENSEDLKKEKSSGDELVRKTLEVAEKLEGSIRNTGTHACGVIIGRNDLTENIPVSIAKDSNLPVTQFDGGEVESVGMLKMDFLGLKTLSIIKDAVENIKLSKNIDIDIESVSHDDELTYKLFSNGETTGIFQFESDGMKKHLKALKPNRFEDLIAMNALYRPGPMEYIPSFVRRKHGEEKVSYDLDACQEFLKETYGITVYQEQVMLLSQKLAGFSKGEADSLRKAMGKKKKDILDKMKSKFVEGCSKNGHDSKIVEKIWKDWEEFAKYAFNKSHSTCYAYVAYRMAWLKAHYPAEFMAAVLSRNLNDIKKVSFFMEECRRMGIPVLGPDVNESAYKFAVNAKGEVRFGLGGIKGVGGSAVESIIKERAEHGPYTSIFDFTKRVDLRSVNKKAIECLALAGSFDSFKGIHRAQYFHADGDSAFIEKAIKFGSKYQDSKNSAQVSLFSEHTSVDLPEPEVPSCEEWGTLAKLSKEKEVVGFYISGHPLDDFKLEIQTYCNGTVGDLHDMEKLIGRDVSFAGIVTNAAHRVSKKGKPFGSLTLEDYENSFSFNLFSDDYVKFKNYLVNGWFLYVQGKPERIEWKQNQLEFKISKMELLTEIRGKMTKGVSLNIGYEDVSEALVAELHDLLAKHPGKDQLSLSLIDRGEKYKVDLFSEKKIDLNDNVISFLSNHSSIKFKLN